MHTRALAPLIAAVILLLSGKVPFLFAGTPESAPSSITWENLKIPETHVQLDSFRQKVNVTLKKESYEFPRSIGITFFDAQGNKTELELKALSPPYDPNAHIGHYSGALSARSAPFVGFEIKIPFGSTSHKILRSNEFKRTTGSAGLNK